MLVQPQGRYGTSRIDLVLSENLIPARVESFHRHFAHEARGLDVRNRLELIQNFVLGSHHSFWLGYQRVGNGNPQKLQMLGIHESWIDGSQAFESANH